MSWDGVYARDRYYPIFNIGDEVTPDKKYRAIAKGKGYIVIDCYNPYPHYPDHNARVIVLVNDMGFECKYASYGFKKSDRQLREDKIKSVLNEV